MKIEHTQDGSNQEAKYRLIQLGSVLKYLKYVYFTLALYIFS